jgi:Transposase
MALPLTDALLGCLQAGLSGCRGPISMAAARWCMTLKRLERPLHPPGLLRLGRQFQPSTEHATDHTVFGAVDSHADTIHVAVVTDRGGQVADAEFPTTAPGYTAAKAFLPARGSVTAIGTEGTSSYGSGFARAACQAGLTVVEVNRPDRAERRRVGKSDPIDAYAAARAVLCGRATGAPKDDSLAPPTASPSSCFPVAPATRHATVPVSPCT